MSDPLRPQRWRRRALALCIGVLCVPLVLEGSLRFAGRFVEGSRAGGDGPATILCQGDSFTFGLYLPPESAYPARLEAWLRASGERDARVVNAGIPSKPTWVLARELAADLRRFRPRVALLLAGVNDRWRRRPDDAGVPALTPRPWRIVTLAQWTRAHVSGAFAKPAQDAGPGTAALETTTDAGAPPNAVAPANFVPTTSVTQKPGVQELHFRDRTGALQAFEILAGVPEEAEVRAWIAADMTAAVRVAREQGVVPVLLAYPGDGPSFDFVNGALEQVAHDENVLFVDCRPEFRRALQSAGNAALYFPDHHTNDVGAEIMARVVLRELVRAKLVDGALARLPEPLAALASWTPPALAVEIVRPDPASPPTHVRVHYAPGYGAVLFAASARGSTQVDFQKLGDVKILSGERPNARMLPLAQDALLVATMRGNEQRTVTLGADGSALLEIPWDAIRAARPGGGEVFAAVAIVLPKVGPVLDVSAALELGKPGEN
ncbi:MAG TPA: GDSL-type esterase/lipase family protein [Planctomycetota bacterium]|nr:GDSL-type esterase/lipase family protein [Planctomycetota bacterium]